VSPYRHCPECRELIWNFNGREDPHKCKPKWFVWCDDQEDEDDAGIIHATDSEAAAEKYTEEYDQDGEYSVVSGSPITVHVRPAYRAGDVEHFEVHGESVPEYRATKLETK